MDSNPNNQPQNQPSVDPAIQPISPTPTDIQPASGGFSSSPPPQTSGKKKKLFLVSAVAVLVLLTGSAAAYFGVYLPNSPDNIWKKAMENTSRGYDKLTESAQKQQEAKGANIKGTYKLDTKDVVVDGNIDSKVSGRNADVKFDAGAAGSRLNFNLVTNVPDGSSNPDLYLKINGLKGIDKLLGAESAGLGQALASFDDQWYVVDHTLFDQIEKEAAKTSGGRGQLEALNQKDIAKIAEAAAKANKEYLFTTDANKAVLTVKQKVGKEKFDNRDAYHYKVGYNKEHLKAYLAAQRDALKDTALKGYISEDEFNNAIKEVDKMKADSQADVWVDLETKLVRNVRFTSDSKNEQTIDIGQKYNGKGDEVPFVLSLTSKQKNNEGTISLTLTPNTKSNVVKALVEGNGKVEGANTTFKADMTITPSNDEVKFEKPANTKSLMEAVGELLGTNINPETLLQQSQPSNL